MPARAPAGDGRPCGRPQERTAPVRSGGVRTQGAALDRVRAARDLERGCRRDMGEDPVLHRRARDGELDDHLAGGAIG